MDQTLDEAIYNRYIAPTKRQRTGRVGLEFELPVVNREHAPVDFEVIHKVTDAFLCKFHFQEAGRDDDGFIYAALDGKGISHKRQSLALVKPLPFYQTNTIFLFLIAVTAILSLSMVRQNKFRNYNNPLSVFFRLSCY